MDQIYLKVDALHEQLQSILHFEYVSIGTVVILILLITVMFFIIKSCIRTNTAKVTGQVTDLTTSIRIGEITAKASTKAFEKALEGLKEANNKIATCLSEINVTTRTIMARLDKHEDKDEKVMEKTNSSVETIRDEIKDINKKLELK